MYTLTDIKACLYNQCCSGKAVTIMVSECVSVTLVIQHAIHMGHIFICGMAGSTIFFYIIPQTT